MSYSDHQSNTERAGRGPINGAGVANVILSSMALPASLLDPSLVGSSGVNDANSSSNNNSSFGGSGTGTNSEIGGGGSDTSSSSTSKSPSTTSQNARATTNGVLEPSAAQRMISACAGSFITSLLVTPLDVVKTRLQSQTVLATPQCAKPFTFTSNASAYEKLCTCCRETFFAPNGSIVGSAPGSGSTGAVGSAQSFVPSSQASMSAVSNVTSAATSTASAIRQNMAKVVAQGMALQQRSKKKAMGPITGWGKNTKTTAKSKPHQSPHKHQLKGHSHTHNHSHTHGHQSVHGCGPSISQVYQEGHVVGMKASSVQSQRLEQLAVECVENHHPARAAQVAHERHFHGTWDGVKKIVKYEGVSSLWRGLSPTLVMSIPATVIYFVGYDYLKVVLATQLRNSSLQARPGQSPSRSKDLVFYYADTFSPLLAGGFARTVAATIISPLELFRTRMQSVHTDTKGNSGLLRGVFQGVVAMVQKDGVLSLWRGLGPTLWRDVPFSAIYWAGYEAIKKRLHEYQAGESLLGSSSTKKIQLNEFEIAFASGALSGMIAATLTTPFDVAKTRRQVDLQQTVGVRMVPLMQSIVAKEGYRGLWRGLTARVAKIAPSCAIMISSYELGKQFLTNRQREFEEMERLQLQKQQ